jgi:hypothetical protein
MGVDLTVYTVVGVRITDKKQMAYVKEVIGDNYDYYQSRECDITVIDDGMCGEYIVIGSIVGSHCRYEDVAATYTSIGFLNSMFEDMPEMIKEEFPDLEFKEISLISFNHYS